MKPLHRREWLARGAALAGVWALGAAAQEGAAPRRVTIVARRFAFEPAEVPLRAGERVAVEIQSLDFVHGFNVPDLHRRFDLVPRRPTRFEFTPAAPGMIEFVCDNFCGDGHEDMHGRFVVT
jgi:cytochrome c oxidase subunit 2